MSDTFDTDGCHVAIEAARAAYIASEAGRDPQRRAQVLAGLSLADQAIDDTNHHINVIGGI